MTSYTVWFVLVQLATCTEYAAHYVGFPRVRPNPDITPTRTFDSRPGEILSQKMSQLLLSLQSGRKFLKNLRKWRNSHPAEMNLARCFARHVVIKFPRLRGRCSNHSHLNDENGNRGVPSESRTHCEKPDDGKLSEKLISKLTPSTISKDTNPSHDQDGINPPSRVLSSEIPPREMIAAEAETPTDPAKNEGGKFERWHLLLDAFKTVCAVITYAKHVYHGNKFIECTFRYLLSKFWTWIDTAV